MAASKIDYDRLEKTLQDIAVGGQESARKVAKTVIDNGVGEPIEATTTSAPDVALLKELLSERIGGPQDWC